jgi:hypothetical protein
MREYHWDERVTVLRVIYPKVKILARTCLALRQSVIISRSVTRIAVKNA